VNAIERHIGRGAIDIVVANNVIDPRFSPPTGVEIVLPEKSLLNSTAQVMLADVADNENPWRHDSHKLASCVMRLLK